MQHRHFTDSIRGFSLIQISIILMVAAIILASLLPGGGGDYNQRVSDNIAKLDKIEVAMNAFMSANGRRPCPADGQYDINSTNFGWEAGSSVIPPPVTYAGGDCRTGSPAPLIVAPLGPDTVTGYVVGGTIPTKSLGLPDDYAFDAWGRRFTYLVDTRATDARTTSATTCYNTKRANIAGAILIKSTDAVDCTVAANTISDCFPSMYAFISYGLYGHGAWPAQGGASRINRGVTDADALVNAGVDASFNSVFTNKVIKKDRTPTFDDLVYYRKDTMNTCCIGSACGTANPNGFKFQGSANDYAGTSVIMADINGDGIDDLIIGAPGTGNVAGKVYVLFGSKNNFSGTFAPASLTGTTGFVINGVAGDNLGTSLAAGDINGDGIKDLIIGAPGQAGTAGKVYVVFGKTTAFTNPFSLNAPNGTTYFRIDGAAAGDKAGTSVAAGNISGHTDGTQDVIIGTPNAATTGGANSGKIYVVFGVAASHPVLVNGAFAVSSINGTNGFEIDNDDSVGGLAGTSVAAGDINGDGKDDVIIGAPNALGGAGKTYIVFGSSSTWGAPTPIPVLLSQLTGSTGINGTNGFVANGVNAGDHSGTSVAVGDINGDGVADLIIGAPHAPGQLTRVDAGSTYVVLGSTTTWTGFTPVSLSALAGVTGVNGTNGFRLDGSTGEQSGTAVAAGCSINGTGTATLLIGAPLAGDSTAVNCAPGFLFNSDASRNHKSYSNSYAVFGATNGWRYAKNLCALNGDNGDHKITNGFYIPGALNESLGKSLASGDINGIGNCAVAIGAPDASSHHGYVYVGSEPSSGWGQSLDLTASAFSR